MDADIQRIVWWLLLLLPSIHTVEAICNQTCRQYPTPPKSLEFKCRKKSEAMFYVDVRSSKTDDQTCDGSTICSGLQAEVVPTVAQCYWNRACVMRMDNSSPNVLDINGSCTSVFPDVFQTRALCVRKKKIFSFFTMRPDVRGKEGIIRISEHFPWDYSVENNYRVIRFKAKSGKKLRLTFLEADVDTCDQVQLIAGQSNFSVTWEDKNRNFDFPSRGDIRMIFSMASSSRRGKGFVFCFYWLPMGASHQQHACDLVGGVKCLPGKVKRPRGRRNRGGRGRPST